MCALALCMHASHNLCGYWSMEGRLGCPALSAAVHGTLAYLQLRSGMPCMLSESWPGRADDIVSDKVRQQLEKRERALQQSEEAPAMTAHEAAEYKRQLTALMQPGESVTEALRRLRPPRPKGTKAGLACALLLCDAALGDAHDCNPCLDFSEIRRGVFCRLQQKRSLRALPHESTMRVMQMMQNPPGHDCAELCCLHQGAPSGKLHGAGRKGVVKAEKTPEEVKALGQFNVITEAASALMDAGEMDIYSTVREELQRAAEKDADEDDMFADADEGAANQVRAASRTGAVPTSRHGLELHDEAELLPCMLSLAFCSRQFAMLSMSVHFFISIACLHGPMWCQY